MKDIELAKYWVCRLDENYGDELKDSAEYKKYYLPLKNYIRDRLGEYQEPTLEQRIELLYKIPQKYLNSNYEEIRDNEFSKLFKVVILVKFHFNQNRKQWFNHPSTHDYYEDIVQHLPTMRNCTYQILDEIPKLDDFVKYYIELKKLVDDYEANSNEWHIRKFNDINKFLKAISPKPLSKYIGLLLEQIKIENQEDSKNTTINVEKDDVLHTDELEESNIVDTITGKESFILLKKLEDRQYKRIKADNDILQNKSFSHWSSEYIKKNFSQELFDEAFEELKLEEILEYSKFVFLTNPPSRWYEKKFINSFIFHCNHSKGRYYYKKNKKKFEYDRNKNVDGKKKKCFLLKNT